MGLIKVSWQSYCVSSRIDVLVKIEHEGAFQDSSHIQEGTWWKFLRNWGENFAKSGDFFTKLSDF